MADALVWYAVVQAAGLAVWPLVKRALGVLDDSGWGVSKVVGLLGTAWLVWLLAMLTPVPYSRVSLGVALLAIAAIGWRVDQTAFGWLRARRELVITWEALFFVAFAVFGLLRAHAPAISSTEKPMDMAFFNGFVAAQRLPTQDSWFAGYGVPYYHFGYLILASAAKLAGTPVGVAYNLAAATVPALAMLGLAALVWNLARAVGASVAWSATGAAIATLSAFAAGNLSTFFELLVAGGLLSADAGASLGIKHFAEGVTRGVWPPASDFWWFHASRVIPNLQPDGINEFPFFSALLSDLHPHFVALPFEVLAVTVAAVHVLSRGQSLRRVLTQVLAALSVGGLLVINTWDIAPFWLLYLGLAAYAARWLAWRWRWLAVALAPVAGAVAFAPYFVGYSGPPLGVGIVVERTPPSSLLVLFGPMLALLVGLGVFVRWCVGNRLGWGFAGGGVLAGLVLAVAGQPTLGLLLALLLLLLPWPGLLDRLQPGLALAVCVGAFASAILLGVELIYLDDAFHTRMNTVFKFHENAWLLAGLAAGLGVSLVGHFTRRVRWLLAGMAALGLAGGLVYPATALQTRLAETPPYGITLDGLAFLSPDERAAARWLAAQNASSTTGRTVIAEGVGNDYSSAARMSTYSGAATVLGWLGHELQWRGPIPELGRRQVDVANLYRDGPSDAIRSILERHAVQFVVVGDIERDQYGPAVETRFDRLLPVAFRSGTTTIYRVS